RPIALAGRDVTVYSTQFLDDVDVPCLVVAIRLIYNECSRRVRLPESISERRGRDVVVIDHVRLSVPAKAEIENKCTADRPVILDISAELYVVSLDRRIAESYLR